MRLLAFQTIDLGVAVEHAWLLLGTISLSKCVERKRVHTLKSVALIVELLWFHNRTTLPGKTSGLEMSLDDWHQGTLGPKQSQHEASTKDNTPHEVRSIVGIACATPGFRERHEDQSRLRVFRGERTSGPLYQFTEGLVCPHHFIAAIKCVNCVGELHCICSELQTKLLLPATDGVWWETSHPHLQQYGSY